MKPVSLLLCGMVVSSLAVPTLAQERPPSWNWHPDRPAGLKASQNGAPDRGFTPPTPRGDLRGDIASNVRERPDPSRGNDQRRR
ncbi:hypothetical protein [Paraburkholderia saeva]|jgi:hypothetical protein|uniref:Uncharacterized protein n=1 Tax=Paraburkholderia saeva TaxID=2777537 RepID=A0A9N8X2I6_9BURK|nr:hypothetical protein [Paraburkholderia saeva]CAG4891140.1 hypothetical protein R52603_01120 [Paraburkholderia saeva]CAG4896174.1 hypothetical protein R70241_02155 [Paraburkholderia saeva]CAG4902360.1 hypothetical protein LMG31841_03098 [Paraburkholderia saeva]